MQEILADMEHMLAQGKVDMPLTLCFAAARRDDLLLQRLLKRGLDPNELDREGHNALVRRTFYSIMCCKDKTSFIAGLCSILQPQMEAKSVWFFFWIMEQILTKEVIFCCIFC